MNNQQYFQTTSLSYRLKAAERELADFHSGEAYVKLRAEYEAIIRSQQATIKKLQKERDSFSFSRKEITRQWMDVLEDVQKEHEKEVKKYKKNIAELLDMIVSMKVFRELVRCKRAQNPPPHKKGLFKWNIVWYNKLQQSSLGCSSCHRRNF